MGGAGPPQLLLPTLGGVGRGHLLIFGVHRPPLAALTLHFGGGTDPPRLPNFGAPKLSPPTILGRGGSLFEEGSGGDLGCRDGGDSMDLPTEKALDLIPHRTNFIRQTGGGGHQNRNTESQSGPPGPWGPPLGLGGDPRPKSVLWGTPPTPLSAATAGLGGIWGFLGILFCFGWFWVFGF